MQPWLVDLREPDVVTRYVDRTRLPPLTAPPSRPFGPMPNGYSRIGGPKKRTNFSVFWIGSRFSSTRADKLAGLSWSQAGGIDHERQPDDD